MVRQVIVDTETTGLSAADRIVEVACVELIGRRPTGREFHAYVNPEMPVHRGALRVHGLTDEFLADKPSFADVGDALRDFLRDAEMVAHNSSFDYDKLYAEFKRAGFEPFSELVDGVVDTLAIARRRWPGQTCSLDAVCRRLGIDTSHRTMHGALVDARILANAYIMMTREQGTIELVAAEATIVAVSATEGSEIIIEPTAEDLAMNAAILAEIDRVSGGKLVWRES